MVNRGRCWRRSQSRGDSGLAADTLPTGSPDGAARGRPAETPHGGPSSSSCATPPVRRPPESSPRHAVGGDDFGNHVPMSPCMRPPAATATIMVQPPVRPLHATGWGRGRRMRGCRALLVAACGLAVSGLTGCTPQGRRDSALHAVRRSLRTTVYAADQHKLATGSYANFMAPPGFAGVTIYISDVSARGFQARATHRRYPRDELECRVGIGPATPLGLAEGEPGGPQCR